ncbi:MAG: NAD(P)-dependent oxidoreductase [Candidatus Omnitrophota bacterium]
MKVMIIGGTGHIGTFLTRILLDDGYEVGIISSGRTPIGDESIEKKVRLVKMKYPDMLSDGTFASLLREKKINVVVDILQGDIQSVYAHCLGAGVSQLVMCGSIWMFGRPKSVPTPEVTQTECPFEGYRQRYAEMLKTIEQSKKEKISVSAIMPPNICGPEKVPLEGMGGRSIDVHRAHQKGAPVVLPFPGTNLIGPCDAEDVARGFYCAVKNRDAAAGEIFNVGSAYALTAEKFIRTYADIYGTRIPIEYVSTEKYIKEISPDLGANFHFTEHMCPDISKISSRVGYKPHYTPEETMERSVKWMYNKGILR